MRRLGGHAPAAPSWLGPALAAAGAAALWPVWLWLARRLTASPDERAGLAAAAAAVAFVWRGRKPGEGLCWEGRGLHLPAALFALYAGTCAFLPPLARAVLGVTALAALASAWRFRQALHPGVWALCLLALPVMPSLQFYCGYALRRLAALGAAGLLHASGFPVSAAGAALEWAGGVVSVDAPCSGLSMLWTMGFMAACLACVSGWGWRGTVGAGALAGVASVAANALRASSLFILETGETAVPGWLHEGVGWVCFAAAAACMAVAAIKGERWAASR